MSVAKQTQLPTIWGDVRDDTHQARIAIGFREKREWKTAHAKFTKHMLKIFGHPVMEDWEVPYMKKLAEIATSQGGIVLEVGFGMGISARFIQKGKISRHIIIEVNHEVAERARKFGKKAKHPVEVVEGLWEEVIGRIPDKSLSGILFDTYPLTKAEIHRNHFFFFKIASRKLKQGGIFTYYSDEIDSYHKEHLRKLMDAGFRRKNIDGEIVRMKPPKNCQYWKSDTILAPIIKK
ncbi:MAG: class I SAM-dependent methyltransferase [bacterium]|nr:class I SAM-dependent methyltransferase [bacterium]